MKPAKGKCAAEFIWRMVLTGICLILSMGLEYCGLQGNYGSGLKKEEYSGAGFSEKTSKKVDVEYEYRELSVPEMRVFFPYLISENSFYFYSDYEVITFILSNRRFLSEKHFIALQGLKETYLFQARRNERKRNVSINLCNKLYFQIKRIFMDSRYDYRLRFKAIEYMELLRERNFLDLEVNKMLESMAMLSGKDNNTKEIRKRAILFIKAHNIM